MFRDGSLRGIVVSTADAFTWHATREAAGTVERFASTYSIDLVDEGKLRAMITAAGPSPGHPWEFGLSFLHID
jgi:hypothetical protein